MTTEIEQALGSLLEIGGAELVNELIGMFLDHAPLHLSAARQASQAGDWRAAERSVHTLKSNAGQLGLESLSNLCARMEPLAKSANLLALAALLDQAEAALADVAPALQIIRAEGLREADAR